MAPSPAPASTTAAFSGQRTASAMAMPSAGELRQTAPISRGRATNCRRMVSRRTPFRLFFGMGSRRNVRRPPLAACGETHVSAETGEAPG